MMNSTVTLQEVMSPKPNSLFIMTTKVTLCEDTIYAPVPFADAGSKLNPERKLESMPALE